MSGRWRAREPGRSYRPACRAPCISNVRTRSYSKLLSYASGTSDTPLLGMTIGEMLDRTAANFPDRLALISRHQKIRWTWTELRDKVDEFARGLISLKVQKGHRVGIWAPNCVEWTLTQFATAKLGAILVTINPAYRLHELEYALSKSGCSLLVAAQRFKKSDYVSMLQELRASEGAKNIPLLDSIITIGEGKIKGFIPWGEVIESSKSISQSVLEETQSQQQFDDPVNIQYTSGTTGFPKGATLSHHNILNNGYFVGNLQQLTEQDKICIPVPLYHCFGMVMGNLACLTRGATMVYPSEGFDAAAVLQTVHEERCTSLYGVPTMFIAELEHPDLRKYDLSSLRTGVMAGSPCPIEVMKKVRTQMHMRDVQICYGMTETSPVSTQTRPDTPVEKRVSTVGQVHPHLEIKIVDAKGNIVRRGETGELCTRGYSVMLGYWDDPESTRKAIDQSRWMHTGDLATMDEEGYVNIVGRMKDMIIRGGENVYPREVEEFLYTHPKISDVQIIGVPDPKYGEQVMAWVKLKAGMTATADELHSFCKGKIAHFKIPHYWKFVDSFPTTVTGKVQKYLMREQAIRELALQVQKTA